MRGRRERGRERELGGRGKAREEGEGKGRLREEEGGDGICREHGKKWKG